MSELGHGGMATVYRAMDTLLGREVALKILHPHLRNPPEARMRFRREAQSVARLRHRAILEIYDYSGEGSEECYIASELLTGPTLKDHVEREGAMPPEVAACFGIEIADALALAHSKGIIHRDVKPENLLLHEKREIKLTDFGIAAMRDAQSMTATGQIIGSPGHMAPEQIEGQELDGRADVFALGTVLYYMVTGVLPFTGKNPHQILLRVLEGQFPDPLRIQPQIGGRFRAILLKAMARNRDERYPSAEALRDALFDYVKPIGIEEPPKEIQRYLTDPKAYSEALKPKIIAAELELARKALSRASVAEASDALARVLALDEQNREAIELSSRLQRRKKRWLPPLGLGLGAALVILAGALGIFSGRLHPPQKVVAHPNQDSVKLPSDHSITLSKPLESASTSSSAAIFVPPAQAQGSTLVLDTPFATPQGVRAPRAPGFRKERRGERAPASFGLRRVVFQPDPQNVRIAVDGSELRPYGPSFDAIDLGPGLHRFRFVPNVDCCAELTIEKEIPPGDSPYVLAVTLPSRPALLIVRSNVPADVVIEGGIQGRARSPIPVPIHSPTRSEIRRITVNAPGHENHTEEVMLSAGAVVEHRVTLRPLPGEVSSNDGLVVR
ncbi:MAG: protein kinase [Deltaproteobacteria bacterium]|nr:protein kinase [Deltaproteobacteria bacterium]